MPSPFPGMDPCLEGQGFWQDFHFRLIAVFPEQEHPPRAANTSTSRVRHTVCPSVQDHSGGLHRDSGELVFSNRLDCHGVILMRIWDYTSLAQASHMQSAWATIEMSLPGKFVVISKCKLRVRAWTTPSRA